MRWADIPSVVGSKVYHQDLGPNHEDPNEVAPAGYVDHVYQTPTEQTAAIRMRDDEIVGATTDYTDVDVVLKSELFNSQDIHWVELTS